MTPQEEAAKKKLSAAMSHALLTIGVTEALALSTSLLAASVATIFRLTDEQMSDINAGVATLIGQKVREAKGKSIKA